MASEPPIDEEAYASSEDSDFAPDDAPEEHASSAGSDEEGDAQPAPSKRKRQSGGDDAEDAGFENSGDEYVIDKGQKGRKKKSKRAKLAADDGGDGGDGGDAGLIKTRSQRAQEKAERKTAAAKGPVTIDVDAVWAQMLAGDAPAGGQANDGSTQPVSTGSPSKPGIRDGAAINTNPDPSDMVKIKWTYNFAGKVNTEEKLVARDSAEAKLYLAQQGEDAALGADDPEDAKRLLRKAFRTRFEPAFDSQLLQRTDLNLGVAMRLQAREQDKDAKKLNVVEKSRMDWAGYVDKEGIQDELALAGRSKGAYGERQQFLARSEAIREEEARRARMAGKA